MLNLNEESSSRPKRRRRYINRDRESAHDRLHQDYFADDCVYPPNYFRRRYRMRRQLFLSIMLRLGEYSPYFTQREDALGRLGLSPLRMISYSQMLKQHGAKMLSALLEC